MNAKKSRRPLTNSDPVAAGFVYGTEPDKQPSSPELPKTPEPTVPTSPKEDLMAKLMKSSEKEATVRLTVDLPESMHRKLSILCAKTGRKKAEVVRMLLDSALEDVEE